MGISRETLELVKERADIVEVIREYVPDLKKVGRNYRALCPFHEEKNPSFYVDPLRNIFHCFGCHVGGDVIKFLRMIEKTTFTESVRKLANKLGIKIKESKTDRSKYDQIYQLLSEVAEFYHQQLKKSQEPKNYLKQRGLNEETLKKFLIGYAQGGDPILKYFSKKYGLDILNDAGIITTSDEYPPHDYFHERIIFPIFNRNGKIIGFGGRRLENTPDSPLYINTPETQLFSKRKELYGLFQGKDALLSSKTAIIVEGYMDVLILQQSGIKNTLAPLGTSFTEEQSRQLKRMVDKVTLVFDSDPGGIAAVFRAAEILIRDEFDIKVGVLPMGVDPDEYLIKNGTQELLNLIEKSEDIFDFILKNYLKDYPIDEPTNKQRIVMEMLRFLEKLKSSIIYEEVLKKMSKHLDISLDSIRSEISRLKQRDKKYPSPHIKPKNIFSIEEEILILLFNYPNLKSQINQEIFLDKKCKKIFNMLMKEKKPENIIPQLSEEEENWFTKLLIEKREYEYISPKKVLDDLIKDLNIQRLEVRKKELAKIISSANRLDKQVLNEYNDIIKILHSLGK